MTAQSRKPAGRRRQGLTHGFTLVEMLVVIGIIVVLMAILVPVVSRMRIAAQTANTNAQLQRISAAINNYFNDYSGYPGLTPNHLFNPTQGNNRAVPNLTQSEDLTLALLGGLVAKGSSGSGYNVEFDPNQVGQGPININIRAGIVKKNPYFAKRDEELTPGADGQLSNEPEFTYVKDTVVPEFMDNFPEQRPILYMRCNPGIPKGAVSLATQRILGPKSRFNSSQFAYNWETIDMYLKTPDTGFTDPKTADFAAKVPNNPTSEPEVFQYFAGTSGDMPRNANGYLLISAGPNRRFGDGDDIIYGSGGGQ